MDRAMMSFDFECFGQQVSVVPEANALAKRHNGRARSEKKL